MTMSDELYNCPNCEINNTIYLETRYSYNMTIYKFQCRNCFKKFETYVFNDNHRPYLRKRC